MSNVLAIEAAKEALDDKSFYNFLFQKIKKQKNKIYKLLDYLNLDYVTPHTNFVFFIQKKDIRDLGQKHEKGVKIGRPFLPFMIV